MECVCEVFKDHTPLFIFIHKVFGVFYCVIVSFFHSDQKYFGVFVRLRIRKKTNRNLRNFVTFGHISYEGKVRCTGIDTKIIEKSSSHSVNIFLNFVAHCSVI